MSYLTLELRRFESGSFRFRMYKSSVIDGIYVTSGMMLFGTHICEVSLGFVLWVSINILVV